jgi:hypothetical protein
MRTNSDAIGSFHSFPLRRPVAGALGGSALIWGLGGIGSGGTFATSRSAKLRPTRSSRAGSSSVPSVCRDAVAS